MKSYLDYAGLGIVRQRAREAMHLATDELLTKGAPAYGSYFTARENARATLGRLLECTPEEIAFVPNTSAGLQLVASGLDWRAGDEIVLCEQDFPANVRPWESLQRFGVRLVRVPMRHDGYDLADFAAAINPATRLVAVSDVNFRTGHRIDLSLVCGLARQFGALVCVDAVQSLGALKLSVRTAPVDFLAAGGHKWLCGPPGTGVFFCRRDRLDELRWAPLGWFGYEGANDLSTIDYGLAPRQNARRFEGGMLNAIGIIGLAESLAEVESIGLEAISARVLGLAGRLRTGLEALGVIVSDAESGIVSASISDVAGVYKQLVDNGFELSLSGGRLRLSPHYWSSELDVDFLLSEMERLLSRH